MQAFHKETRKATSGHGFRIEHHYDPDTGPPWENCDGHGVVTDWVRRHKRPGELVLNSDGRGSYRYYDFQASIKIARRDHWNSWSMSKSVEERGAELVRAVMQDFHYLRAWCNDEWRYMGVMVFPLTPDGDELRSKQHSLWGVESDAGQSYIEEVERELLRACGADI